MPESLRIRWSTGAGEESWSGMLPLSFAMVMERRESSLASACVSGAGERRNMVQVDHTALLQLEPAFGLHDAQDGLVDSFFCDETALNRFKQGAVGEGGVGGKKEQVVTGKDCAD